jgi:hypothetical protein
MKWTKGFDPFDDSPRYSFEGRDPQISLDKIQVVIIQENYYPYVSAKREKRYVGHVINTEIEHEYQTKPYRKLADCKLDVEKYYRSVT